MKKWWPYVAAALIAAGIFYLRDPPWLIYLDSGFQAWERNREGRRLRWMGEHGWFFVPAGVKAVSIPIHAIFLADDRSPFVVRVYVNDRPATEIVLPDEAWRSVNLKMVPRRGWPRRLARIDLRANRTWSDRTISVQVGEVIVERRDR